MSPPETLSAAQARRIALAAQGFADPAPRGTPGIRALRRVLGRVGLLQIDSVNVLVRSHYLPLFSRLGAYPPALLERAAYRSPRELFEYWGHEASLLPVTTQPLLRWRMARAESDAWARMRRIQADRPWFVDEVRALVAARGPVGAGEIAEPRAGRAGPWWDWDDTKTALEWLFYTGEITTASRRGFERLYDLTERVLPAPVLAAPTPEPAAAHRGLVRIAARALGVATERDLRDYFRLSVADARAAVAALAEDGELVPVRVEGWRPAAYLDPAARLPRRVPAATLLSPFDSLVWDRSRTERVWDFRYRLEIYTPAHKRVHGYYVLPFLLGEHLVARVDLKSDRAAGVLRVPGAHLEHGHAAEPVAAALGPALHRLAAWLGLAGVAPPVDGDLAVPLSRALRPGPVLPC
ncbi:MAG: uncharacterized protein QOC93_3188 [Actinomycetota bacterium]|jgi:uncharacterized protein YcaQ|nr:uncharacterized protein [Actinomycetota bacterium]